MPMYKIATLPVSYMATNITDRDALIPVSGIDYTNPKTTPFPKNESHQSTDAVAYSSDSRGGSDMTNRGCIWSGTKAGGLENTRIGDQSASSVVKTGATGVSEGTPFHSIAVGSWLSSASSPCLPNVVGLSWLWDWRDPDGNGATYDRSTYVTKAALMYTDRNLNRRAYDLSVHSGGSGGVYGTAYNSGTDGKFFSYRVGDTAWDTICNPNNPLFFMGVLMMYYSDQGGSSTPYLLASTVWDAVPIVSMEYGGRGMFTDWSTNSDPLHMTVKEQHVLSRLNTSDSERMNALQGGIA